MTFNPKSATKAYVWIWLPHQCAPVVAGMLEKQSDKFAFTYGRSYRDQQDAISFSPLKVYKGIFQL